MAAPRIDCCSLLSQFTLQHQFRTQWKQQGSHYLSEGTYSKKQAEIVVEFMRKNLHVLTACINPASDTQERFHACLEIGDSDALRQQIKTEEAKIVTVHEWPGSTLRSKVLPSARVDSYHRNVSERQINS